MALTQPPLSLYVHFPWCVRKCPYCDFNSHETREIPEQSYLKALLQDFDQDSDLWRGRQLQSIFFGGGTPSLFRADTFTELLAQLAKRIAFAADIEITLEANPGTFEQEKFKGYFQAGINRLSLGVQSFHDHHLTALGRIHGADEARFAVERAQQAGFSNLNIDLMHGLPQQTIEQALADLATALQLNPTHLSWYQLTIEPNTVFYNQPPQLPADESLWQIQQQGQALMAAQGFNQYEVSAYSVPQKRSRHNLNYWQFGDYLALGAGAHGKITQVETGQIIRYQKTRLPKDYLAPEKAFTASHHSVPRQNLAFEFFMNGLRLNQGASRLGFKQYTGLSESDIATPIQQALNKELLHITSSHWVPTEKGHLFLNDLLDLFL